MGAPGGPVTDWPYWALPADFTETRTRLAPVGLTITMPRKPVPARSDSMILRSAALTDIGRVRRQNEDRFLRNETLRLFGVADGVGGLPGGALAARTAVEQLEAALEQHRPQQAQDLVPVVREINGNISAIGTNISPGVGIGTTLTFGVVVEDKLLLAHVGDSRCYRLSNGRLHLLTEDHSVENEARHRRERGELVDFAERYRNALTRCIGQPAELQVDTSEYVLAPDDVILFASDGITRVLEDAEIE